MVSTEWIAFWSLKYLELETICFLFPLSSIIVMHYLLNYYAKDRDGIKKTHCSFSTPVRQRWWETDTWKGWQMQVVLWLSACMGSECRKHRSPGLQQPRMTRQMNSLDFCLLCFYSYRYIPAVVDHTAGLPCQGTFLLHQVLKSEREQHISQLFISIWRE